MSHKEGQRGELRRPDRSRGYAVAAAWIGGKSSLSMRRVEGPDADWVTACPNQVAEMLLDVLKLVQSNASPQDKKLLVGVTIQNFDAASLPIAFPDPLLGLLRAQDVFYVPDSVRNGMVDGPCSTGGGEICKRV